MWVIFALLVAVLLMVALAPKPNLENARQASLGDFQVPRAKYGDPVALVWGTVRAKSPVACWVGDLVAAPMTQKVPSGLFSSKRVITGYKYSLGFDLFWCLGGRTGNTVVLKRLWAGKHVIWEGNLTADGLINIAKPNLFGGDKERGGLVGTIAFYNGGFNPTQDSYLLAKCHPNVPAYNGFCRTVFRAFYVGTSTSIESFSAELSRITNNLSTSFSVMPNGLDVNPMEVLYDALTEQWGRFGATQEDIDLDSWRAAAEVLHTEVNGMSLFIQTAIDGKRLAEEVLRQADAVLYQDPATAKIKVKLIRQDYDIETLPVLDDSMVLELTEFSKSTWEAAFNQCRVTFRDRASGYEDSSALAQDFALINYQQRVKGTDVSFPGCADGALANRLAARQLSFMNVPLFKVDLTCNRKASELRPGMVVKFNWGPYGLTNLVLRVLRVDLGQLENGTVRLSCIQDRFSTSTPVFATPTVITYTPPNLDPGLIVTRRAFEPPHYFTRALSISGVVPPGQNALLALARKPNAVSLSIDTIVSTNGGSSTVSGGTEVAYSPNGTLAADFLATARDTNNFSAAGFTVESPVGGEELFSTTLADARDGRALVLVNDEWMLYTSVTVGATVIVTNVYRGLFDSTVSDHLAGSRVWFVSYMNTLMELPIPIGSALVQMVDNAPGGQFSNVTQPFDTVVVTSPGKAARAYPPDFLTLNGSRTPPTATGTSTVTAAWRHRSREAALISVYNDASDTPAEAGVTYTLRHSLNGGSDVVISSIATTSQAITVTGLVGSLRVRVWSVRLGVESATFDELFITLA